MREVPFVENVTDLVILARQAEKLLRKHLSTTGYDDLRQISSSIGCHDLLDQMSSTATCTAKQVNLLRKNRALRKKVEKAVEIAPRRVARVQNL